MARKAIIEKWSKAPKYKTRAYTRTDEEARELLRFLGMPFAQ